jgi:hypothetical protein
VAFFPFIMGHFATRVDFFPVFTPAVMGRVSDFRFFSEAANTAPILPSLSLKNQLLINPRHEARMGNLINVDNPFLDKLSGMQ